MLRVPIVNGWAPFLTMGEWGNMTTYIEVANGRMMLIPDADPNCNAHHLLELNYSTKTDERIVDAGEDDDGPFLRVDPEIHAEYLAREIRAWGVLEAEACGSVIRFPGAEVGW